MSPKALRFANHALGRPYHAAHIRIGAREGGTDLHTHADFYELMGIVGGRGEHRLATGTQPLRFGDMILVRPGDQHAIRGIPPYGLAFINVAFPADAWHCFLDLSGADPQSAWERSSFPPRVSLTGPLREKMQDSFSRVVTAFGRSPQMRDLLAFWCDAVEFLTEGTPAGGVDDLEDSYEHKDSLDRAEGTRPSWLVRARVAMRREENLRGGVPRLVELAGVSAAHLSRSMRAHYGTTPTEFVTRLRIEHACTLLATTGLTVTDIAYRCGFASQSYFTRCFRKTLQISPREFRARVRHTFVP
ncbi:MAG TPA: AraC family transcriptional regulator [Actinopolymorphaceae bacterium]|jgi:AraC family cel operon transcriptional repressor